MPTYRITAPNGKIYQIEGPPGASDADVAAAVVAQFPEAGREAPETTTAGQVKEFAKGIPAGAIGLLETAAVGASNILPQAEEDSAKKAIREFASAVKQPFAANEGYEDTVGRKFGEALGSTAPFFALGPLGMAGKAAATGLAAGAGAGGASTRAEAKGATQDQQTLATIGGTAVGLTEMLPVFHFLEKLGGPVKDGIMAYVRRAAATGGVEGAQEAAAQMAQNLIAQKIYDPSQELVQGSGEAGAYGFGVGALIQGITDMALGRKGGSGVSGGTTPIEEIRAAARAKAEAAKAKEQTPPLQLGYDQNPQLPPMIAFPDGTVATREEAEQYIASLPEEEQVAARAKLYGLGAQDAGRSVEKKGFDYAGDTATGELFTDTEQAAGTDYDARAFASESILEPAPEGETRAEQVTKDTLARLGVKPNSALAKRILGKRLDRTSELKYVRDEVEKYLEKGYGKPEQRQALDGFLRNIDTFTAPTKEMNFAPPRVRKKGQRDSAIRPTEPTGTEGTVGEVSAAPSQPSVGVASEPVAEFTASETVASPVGVSEPATTAGNGESAGEQPTLKTIVRELALQEQIAAGWDTNWPFIPADLLNSDFRALIKNDPSLDENTKKQIFKAGYKLGVVPKVELGSEAPAYAGQDMRVSTVENDAVDQQRAEEPAIRLVEKAYGARNQLMQQRNALRTALENIKTPSGKVLEKDKAAYDSTAAQLEVVEAQLKEANKFIKRYEGTKPQEDVVTAADKVDRRETTQEVFQRIDQAIGAYNNPSSVPNRRQLSLDYIFDELVANSGENLEQKPNNKTNKGTNAKRNYALNALAYGVDHNDLKPSQRATLYRLLGLDAQQVDTLPPAKRSRAIEEAADKLLAGPAQSWGDQLFYRGETRTPSVEEQQRIETELKKQKDVVGVANWISKNAPEYLRPVAARVRDKLAQLIREGYTIDFRIPNELPRDSQGREQIGLAEFDEAFKVARVHFVGTANKQSSGMRYDVILHELVHIATHGGINKNKELRQALEDVIKEVRKANDPSKATGFNLWASSGLTNTLDSPDEVLTWALTDTRAADMLRSVPFRNATLWKRVVDAIRSYFGLAPKYSNALEEVLRVSDKIFSETAGIDYGSTPAIINAENRFEERRIEADDERELERQYREEYPKQLQQEIDSLLRYIERIRAKKGVAANDSEVDYTLINDAEQQIKFKRNKIKELASEKFSRIATPETEAIANYDIIGDKDRPGFTERASAELGPNKVRGLRTKLTDKLAAADDIFTRAWNGRVRDSEGVLNPIVLISRALDSLRVSKAVQETGGLSKVDDLYVASELTIPEDSTEFPLIAGQSVSYQKVLQRIATAAKQDGRTYEAEQRIIDSVLYGRREYELRQAEANGQGPFEYLLTAEQAAQANQAFENNLDIQEISQMLDAIRYNLIDSMVDSGRISSDQADAWKAATGYIPFKRLSEDDVVGALSNARGVNQGIAALRNIKRFKGSEDRKSTSVIENFSGLVDYMTTETMRNDAGLQALETLELLNYARRIPTPDVIDNDRRAGVATIYKDGQKQHYFMEDPALAVVFSQQPAQVSNVLRGFQKASQVLRAGVTAAPPFAIKQIFDDIIRAYTYAGVHSPGPMMVRILSSFPKNWYNEALGKKSTAVKELERLGIIGTFDFTESSNLQNVMEEAGAKQRGIGATILRVMEAGAKASDISVREAVYKQVLKETGDVAAAESRAREIINFSRRGSAKAMDYMVRIVPFFNAYARGMDKLLVAAAGNSVGMSTGQARSKFYQRMATLTAMGLTYAILMSDDEEYDRMANHTKDQNWIIPNTSKYFGAPLGIPVPPELAFFFKAIPERVVQYYKLAGTDEEREALSYVKELLLRGVDIFSSPNVTPQLIKPLMENIANYSFFLGRPLESQSQIANLRPFQRYGTGTSEAAKAIGVGLENVSNATGIDVGVSPIKIENLIRGLLGTTAGTVLAFSDVLINPSRADRPLHRNEFAQATGASALMKDKLGTRYLDELYNLEKDTNQVHGTFNKLKESDPERAVDFLEENYGLYSIRGAVQNYMEKVRQLNEMAMKVDKSEDFTPREKREFIDEMKEYQLQLARDVFALRKLARDAQASM